MKRLLNYSTLFWILIFFSTRGMAGTFGFVNSIKNGNVFLVDSNESAKILKKGEFLEEDSQMLVEEGAMVTFSDYHDHQFLLSSGGLILFKTEGITLSRGHLRVKTLASEGKKITIETPNSWTSFTGAEGVISFDPEQGKTNVYSFDGIFDFRGKKDLNSSVDVWGGNSSFVKNDYQLGMPSIPEKTRGKELDKIANVFLNNSVGGRKIASKEVSRIIFIRAKPHKPLESQKRAPSSLKKASGLVPINIYGNKGARKPSSAVGKPVKNASGLDSLLKDLKSQGNDSKSL